MEEVNRFRFEFDLHHCDCPPGDSDACYGSIQLNNKMNNNEYDSMTVYPPILLFSCLRSNLSYWFIAVVRASI